MLLKIGVPELVLILMIVVVIFAIRKNSRKADHNQNGNHQVIESHFKDDGKRD